MFLTFPTGPTAINAQAVSFASSRSDGSKRSWRNRIPGSGESANTIAATLGVSRATVYRVLAEQTDDAR
jgi:DNA invertase Pin-like site-specific DNA recombinase